RTRAGDLLFSSLRAGRRSLSSLGPSRGDTQMGAAADSPKLQHGYPTPGPQSPAGQQVMDPVFFLSNTEWKRAREEVKYDFVIVGSGFCALAFSERALRNQPGCRILVIERGPFFLPEHFQNLPL